MAKKAGQSTHSKILSWLFKTAGLLAVFGVALVLIYDHMPNDQKRLVNNFTGRHASQVNSVKNPIDFTQATKELHDNGIVPINNVHVNVDGKISGDIGGRFVQSHLASVGMIGKQSAFYRANAPKIRASLQKTLVPNDRTKYTVKETKDHGIYLFINGKMFQQTWLERGLAYINVPQGYDSESTTLDTAQNTAQGNDANIWQVNGAMQQGKHGYHLDRRAESEYLNNKPVSFDEKNQSTNFWGKLTKFLR